MATTVIHFRDWDQSNPDHVYIGRAVPRKGLRNSLWSNPFRVGESHPRTIKPMSRDDVIDAFRYWVETSTGARPSYIREHVHELRGKKLVCWCKPDNPCYGDILAKMADAFDVGGVA